MKDNLWRVPRIFGELLARPEVVVASKHALILKDKTILSTYSFVA